MRFSPSHLLFQMLFILTNCWILTLSSESTTSNYATKNATAANNSYLLTTQSGITTTPSSVETTTTATVSNLNHLRCRTAPIPERQYITACCEYIYTGFAASWTGGGFYLTTTLERLQRWHCDQFKKECEHPTYIFTEFTRRVYERFCNPSKHQNDCLPSVQNAIQKYKFMQSDIAELSNWTISIELLQSDLMDWNDLTDPCIQLALFDRQDGGVGRFHEIIEPYVPYCGLQWNGMDYNTAMNGYASSWTTMSIGWVFCLC